MTQASFCDAVCPQPPMPGSPFTRNLGFTLNPIILVLLRFPILFNSTIPTTIQSPVATPAVPSRPFP